MQWSMSVGSNGNSDVMTKLYKTFLTNRRLQNYNDATVSTTLNAFNLYRNLTINSTVTTSANTTVVICDTLTLNGTIDATSAGANGGVSQGGSGAGGKGGGAVFVFARQISTTNGIIQSNGGVGLNGATPTTYSAGNDGSAGYIGGTNLNTMYGHAGLYTTAASAAGGNAGVTSGSVWEGYLRYPTWMAGEGNPFNTTAADIFSNTYSAGGGSGACDNGNASSYQAGGGGGGGSFLAAGGVGGFQSLVASASVTGGGGGGGAGIIYIFTENPIPAGLTVKAIGGNGANPYGAGGAGGGGAGGYIGLWTPFNNATTVVTGGTAGSQTGGTGATAGGNGDVDTFYFAP